MTFDEYREVRAVNWSTLKFAEISMEQYRHAKDNPSPDTRPRAVGRATHTSILEPDRFALDCAVYDKPKSKGEGSRTAWETFQEANAGRTILNAKEYDRCLRMRDAVRQHPVAGPYVEGGVSETVIEWTDAETRLRCKARIDKLPARRDAFVDLKSTRNPSPWAFARDAAKYGYHRQAAFYMHGIKAALGEDREPIMIAVQNVAPFEVWVYRFSGPVLHEAWEEQGNGIASLLVKVAHAERTGNWRGGCHEVLQLNMPPYVPGAESGTEFMDTDPADDVPLGMEA